MAVFITVHSQQSDAQDKIHTYNYTTLLYFVPIGCSALFMNKYVSGIGNTCIPSFSSSPLYPVSRAKAILHQEKGDDIAKLSCLTLYLRFFLTFAWCSESTSGGWRDTDILEQISTSRGKQCGVVTRADSVT